MMRTQLCFRGESPVEVALFEDPKRDWRCWVSRDGRAFSYRKGRQGYHKLKTHDKAGYLELNSYGHFLLHRVVLYAWVGPRPGPDYQCDHIDFNPHNNHIDNLRWLTRAENNARRREWVRYDWTIEVRGRQDDELIDTLHSTRENQYWKRGTKNKLDSLPSCVKHVCFTRNYRLVVTKTPKNKQIIDL